MRFAGISSRTRPLRYESDVHLAPTPYKSDAHALLHCPGTLLTQQLATGDIAPSIVAPQGSRARSQGQRRQAAAPPRIPRSRRTARIPRDQQRPPRAPAASCAPRAPLPSSCQTRGIPAALPAPALGDCSRAAGPSGGDPCQRFVRTRERDLVNATWSGQVCCARTNSATASGVRAARGTRGRRGQRRRGGCVCARASSAAQGARDPGSEVRFGRSGGRGGEGRTGRRAGAAERRGAARCRTQSSMRQRGEGAWGTWSG